MTAIKILGQGRAGQGRAGQGKGGQDRAGQCNTCILRFKEM